MIAEIKYHDSIQHPVLFKDEDAEVYVEDSSVGWMVHCYVHNWSKFVYQKLLDLLIILKEKSPHNELFCVSNNSKLTKFASGFGFVSIDTLYDSQGEEIGVLMKC